MFSRGVTREIHVDFLIYDFFHSDHSKVLSFLMQKSKLFFIRCQDKQYEEHICFKTENAGQFFSVQKRSSHRAINLRITNTCNLKHKVVIGTSHRDQQVPAALALASASVPWEELLLLVDRVQHLYSVMT